MKCRKKIIVTFLLIYCGIIFAVSQESKRYVELTYNVEIKEIPKKSDKLAVWIPIPLNNSIQRLKKVSLSTDIKYSILTEEKYGNKFIYIVLPGKEIQASQLSLTALFSIERLPYKKHKVNDIYLKDMSFSQFLSSSSLIPLDGKIAEEAFMVTKGIKNPLRQAKLLFDHIVATVKYDKSGVGWGKGDALYACDVRAGNCTDFHSLFIGEARALGIPARFIMGVPLSIQDEAGIIPGYHCWAEFYIKGKGWIPLDASEAGKNLERKEKYFGNLDFNRIAFTLGRDIQLPHTLNNPLNYFIYPYAEVDSKEFPVTWKMSFKNL